MSQYRIMYFTSDGELVPDWHGTSSARKQSENVTKPFGRCDEAQFRGLIKRPGTEDAYAKETATTAKES